MYIEGSSGVMYRVYDPIAHTTENCVLRILHLDMTTNKKNSFTFTCLFALNTWTRTRYGNLY